jgi:hypothetical protein
MYICDSPNLFLGTIIKAMLMNTPKNKIPQSTFSPRQLKKYNIHLRAKHIFIILDFIDFIKPLIEKHHYNNLYLSSI